MKHASRTILVLATICGLSLLGPSHISAQVTVFEDDFSGTLEKWQPTRDDGSRWRIADGKVEIKIDPKFTISELVPKDQYWSKDWKNIEFEFELTPLAGVDRNTSFGWESLVDWFEVHFVQTLVNLVRIDDGVLALNEFDTFGMKNGQTYQVKIRLEGQTVKVWIDGNLVSEATDTKYQSNGGKVGLKAGTGAVAPTHVQFDNVKVSWLDGRPQPVAPAPTPQPPQDVVLNVPLFRQTDPLWKNNLYDHADRWSDQPTIERWGCLTSSLAMVLNFHGMTALLDGTLLNPDSLNSWLRTQADGYIGSGYVNWQAVTRLTRLLSQANGTPKLEYTRTGDTSIATSLDQLGHTQPVVLEVPGHFLVGKGHTANHDDILINDPWYSYDRLSQHTELRSTRVLVPSFTNLSYLLITHDPKLQVTLTHGDGSAITELEQFNEHINDPDSGQAQPPLAITQLAKPTKGTYILSVSQPNIEPFAITIYAYDKAANVTDLSQQGWIGPTPQTFTIEFDPEGSAVIKSSTSFSQFRQALAHLQASGAFLKQQVFDQLDKHAAQGGSQSTNQLQRINQLSHLVIAFSRWFDLPTKLYLEFLLHQLEQTLT